jgi:hypothetical protein
MGGGKAQPPIVEMHAGLAKAGAVKCLDCHQAVGHVYDEPKKPAASDSRATERLAAR